MPREAQAPLSFCPSASTPPPPLGNTEPLNATVLCILKGPFHEVQWVGQRYCSLTLCPFSWAGPHVFKPAPNNPPPPTITTKSGAQVLLAPSSRHSSSSLCSFSPSFPPPSLGGVGVSLRGKYCSRCGQPASRTTEGLVWARVRPMEPTSKSRPRYAPSPEPKPGWKKLRKNRL